MRGSQIPQQSMNMGVYLNCYLFQHKEPLGSGDTEIVLRALQMPDPIPPPVMITNVLEDFETAAIVTPPTPTTLYDFENGIAGWGVEWNYNYGFLANSGSPFTREPTPCAFIIPGTATAIINTTLRMERFR
jgi:hypothetical protein